jgi:hypothetical protein
MQKARSVFKSLKDLLVWIFIILVLGLLINNRHHKTGTFNWTTPLWADQVGYYVYLPSVFIYDFDAKGFPEKIEEKTGFGFSLDQQTNKIITRYTCGIAILQAPFFLIIHEIAGLLGQPQDGFSGIYHKVPDLAALFYCILGLFFLRRFLFFYFKSWIAWFTIFVVFFGTNLYYFAVDCTGMSHVYSFGLFACVAWLSKMIQSDELKNRILYVVGWGLVFALIVLIRPTNILIFPFLFCLDCRSFEDFRQRVKRFFVSGDALVLFVSFLLVFLPQFLYWKYASGSYVTDSYHGFGFTNWKSPKILELWFSPNNGLFLYNPVFLVAVIGLILMIRGKLLNGWIILVTFLLATYIYASWFVFSFGCSYGSRNFVEYGVLFSLPLGYIFMQLKKISRFKQSLVIGLFLALAVLNVKMIYSYSKCFQGGTWDFDEYLSFIVKIKKYHESLEMDGNEKILPKDEYSKTMYIPASKLYYLNYKKAVVRAKVKLEDVNSQASLVVSVETPDSSYYWNAFRLRDRVEDNQINKNVTVEGEFWLPVPLPKEATIVTYIWNTNKETLSLSKLDFYLE